MADGKSIDPLISAEQEVEVDAETAAAIERGVRAADEGRVVSAAEVRQLIPQWGFRRRSLCHRIQPAFV